MTDDLRARMAADGPAEAAAALAALGSPAERAAAFATLGREAAADAVEAVLAGAPAAAPHQGASPDRRNTSHTHRLSWAAP